jgi:cyclopropane-fatty-acyl-phospholipid synthase
MHARDGGSAPGARVDSDFGPGGSGPPTQRTDGAKQPGPAMGTTRNLLDEIFGPPASRSFGVRLWDGTEEGPPGAPPFTLVLRHPGSLRSMLLPPTELTLGEAFMQGDVDIEGDLVAATGLAEPIVRHFRSPRRALPFLFRLRALPKRNAHLGNAIPDGDHRASGSRHSRARDRSAVRYHYDLDNAFYRLWLDERMVYSCAYFAKDGEESLDHAQEAKLDLVCRKLRLREEERFLDIGCGWGALVMHAAERYGVDATGITLSPSQAALARERIRKAGLQERCRVELLDYREMPRTLRFDKIASIGMVEHVGRRMLPTYFGEAFRLLEPGGVFLNHGIVHLNPDRSAMVRFAKRHLRSRVSFIDRHIFPDSELMTPAKLFLASEAAGFEMRDVESLREHYARTTRLWVRRLQERRSEAVAMVGEPTVRAWQLYMAGSAYLFRKGSLGVIQTLLAKRDSSGRVRLPATRADVYERDRAREFRPFPGG